MNCDHGPLSRVLLLLLAFTTHLRVLAFSFLRFEITHNDTTQSVGLLSTRDRPVAETSIRQHTTLTRDDIHAPGGLQTRNSSKRSAPDPCLRPLGHWDRPPCSRGAPKSAPHCPRTASASLYPPQVVHEIFLGFRWILMSPYSARSFCFWLQIMDPAFICSYYALQKSIPFSLITPQKAFTAVSNNFQRMHFFLIFIINLYIYIYIYTVIW